MHVTVFVLILLSIVVGRGELDTSNCPLWTYHYNNATSCKCGSTANGIVHCNTTTGKLGLHVCVCLTYDRSTNETIVGYCPYSCVANLYEPKHFVLMNDTASNITCGIWNREGPLCSKCIRNHGIPLYTYYSLKCVECPRFELKKLFRFLAISLLPPTILFLFVTIFHFTVLQPPLSVFVLTAQALTIPLVLKSAFNMKFIGRESTRVQTVTNKVIATVYGPWNLDFFKALYDPECISPGITNLEAIVIDGFVGIYPLILLFLFYILVILRDHGCRIVLLIYFAISRFRSSFNLNSHIIGRYAAFYLLSYMKIGFSAVYILMPTRVWSPDGNYIWVVYADPSLTYFGASHIGYAVITLLLALVLIIFPVVLLLFYPFQWFQRFLHFFKLRSLPLNTFVDAFQGCYKDGTNGTRDFRCFAALQLMLRLAFSVAFAFTKEPFVSMFISSVGLGLYIAVFAICRPYKEAVYNKTDIPVLMVLLLGAVELNVSPLIVTYNYTEWKWLSSCVITVCVIVPLIYYVVWMFLHAIPIITNHKWCKRWPQHTQETTQLLPHTE